MKLPPLWEGECSSLFIQVEANFRVAQITNDDTKYNYMLAATNSNTLGAVLDLIVAKPTDNKYQALKERLIKEFSDSQSRQIRKLLSELALGDKNTICVSKTSEGTSTKFGYRRIFKNNLVRVVAKTHEGNFI
ncbi:hypothetical protein AVEN_266630-1 [Araneus ventricosus]|uniref:DUF7041 domain-containing protein n=1 Tax=Araneus ventricosus TaxID=182803 RepID=A0A4Y2PJJ9_ARAVE|nr:hypothetical protein AVEN_266630-1 [Araneus ventricosus]